MSYNKGVEKVEGIHRTLVGKRVSVLKEAGGRRRKVKIPGDTNVTQVRLLGSFREKILAN